MYGRLFSRLRRVGTFCQWFFLRLRKRGPCSSHVVAVGRSIPTGAVSRTRSISVVKLKAPRQLPGRVYVCMYVCTYPPPPCTSNVCTNPSSLYVTKNICRPERMHNMYIHGRPSSPGSLDITHQTSARYPSRSSGACCGDDNDHDSDGVLLNK